MIIFYPSSISTYQYGNLKTLAIVFFKNKNVFIFYQQVKTRQNVNIFSIGTSIIFHHQPSKRRMIILQIRLFAFQLK